MGIRRNAAKVLATAIVASAALTATAHASTHTIGPTDLVNTGLTITGGPGGAGVTLNTEYAGGAAVEVPVRSKIKVWRGNFECSDGCGQVRLVQLRPTTITPDDFVVIDTSDWEAPTLPGGVQTMSADFAAEEGDLLAFEGSNYGKVLYSPAMTGGRTFTSGALGGNVFTRINTGTGTLALYNADYIPYLPTETTLTGTPNPVPVNGAVTLTAAVTAAAVENNDPTPDPTGTVAFTQGGTPISGCSAVALVNGTASCPTTAGPYSGNPLYEAKYSGDTVYADSTGDTHVRALDVSTTTASVTPNPVARLAPITYVAEISGAAVGGGEVSPAEVSNGNVAFSVDGVPVAGCAAQPVNHEDIATCETLAPLAGGTHTLKADFAGSKYLTPSTGNKDFVVLAPAVTVPATTDFGSVTAGAADTRTVVLTNSGAANLTVGGASIKVTDAFAITADACTGVTLMPGAGCSVQVTFSPAAATAYAAELVFSDDADEGTHSTTLTGTGVAAPVPPTAPTPPAPTATPTPTPQPGATLAPGAKPTLTVTAPPSSNPNAAPTLSLPLSCPANQECQLDGTLKINTSSLSKSARAAAAETTTVARFSKVQIAQGKLKTIKLKLSPAFVKSAQKRGIRKIKATLTINTVLGSGERITTRQQVTVLIPKAPKVKAAPKVQPKFTG